LEVVRGRRLEKRSRVKKRRREERRLKETPDQKDHFQHPFCRDGGREKPEKTSVGKKEPDWGDHGHGTRLV